MSGGSLDYIFGRVDQTADHIERMAENPTHRAFAAHLRKVAKALHDLEWVWSGDKGDGDEVEAIMAVISPSHVLEEATRAAKTARDDLDAALFKALEAKEPRS